jgi:hypothetical protein
MELGFHLTDMLPRNRLLPPNFNRVFYGFFMVQELYGCYTFLPEGDGTKVIYKLRVEPGFPLPKMIKQATNKAICTTGMCSEVCAHAPAWRVR